MAKSKTKTKNGQPQNRRKIGERLEVIIEKLSPMQVDEERAKVCDCYAELEALEEERKKITADVKARIASRKAAQKEAAACATSARRKVEVTVEEWLTDTNEVIRVRTDTGEVLGQRTARMHEQQEELPGLEPAEPDDKAEAKEDSDGFGGEST